MTQYREFPDHIRRLGIKEKISFSCHPGVSCFNECCRELELALTPYDSLRLARELGLSTGEFLDQYVIVEHEEGYSFPHLYLGMVDDGHASCPFVTEKGCRVYQGRPGACRAYPVGRASGLGSQNKIMQFHVLITEPHCQGFEGELEEMTVNQWTSDQGLTEYNEINDELLSLMHHPKIKKGMVLSAEQRDRFLLALYDLDAFRKLAADSGLDLSLEADELQAALVDDIVLLRVGIRLLKQELFDE